MEEDKGRGRRSRRWIVRMEQRMGEGRIVKNRRQSGGKNRVK